MSQLAGGGGDNLFVFTFLKFSACESHPPTTPVSDSSVCVFVFVGLYVKEEGIVLYSTPGYSTLSILSPSSLSCATTFPPSPSLSVVVCVREGARQTGDSSSQNCRPGPHDVGCWQVPPLFLCCQSEPFYLLTFLCCLFVLFQCTFPCSTFFSCVYPDTPGVNSVFVKLQQH